MKNQDVKKGEIIIYKTSKNKIDLKVHFEDETVWLKQNEIAFLFSKERSVITKHINKIFKDKEIDKKSNVQKIHIAFSDKPVEYYSLDVILAVGYRTNSPRAIHFRQWATMILKEHLIKGYTVNEKRLLQAQNQFSELQSTITFLQEKVGYEELQGQEQEIFKLLTNYSKTLSLLEQYDSENLQTHKDSKSKFILTYPNCIEVISEIKKELLVKKEATHFFGQENGDKFKSVIGNIYQTFDKVELYFSLEEKAANLIYFIIKDHPFIDGNKRIGSFLFVYFLDKNNFLYKKNGEKKINDNALTALSLLIAMSNPEEKEKLVNIITNLLSE